MFRVRHGRVASLASAMLPVILTEFHESLFFAGASLQMSLQVREILTELRT